MQIKAKQQKNTDVSLLQAVPAGASPAADVPGRPVHPAATCLDGIAEAAIWLSRQSVTDQSAVLSLLDAPLRSRVLTELAMRPLPSQFPGKTVETALRSMGHALHDAGRLADPETGG